MSTMTSPVDILYDARWIGNHGIGRFASELQKRLPGLESFHTTRRPWHPFDPVFLGASLWRLKPRLFFSPGYNSPIGYPGPFVFTLHDLNHLRIPDNSSALKRAYYRYCIRPACARAEFVLTVSEYSKSEIVAWAKIDESKVVNVGNGVGSPFAESGEKYQPGYPYILYVGSRKAYKNLSRLLRAFAISGLQNEIRLLLAGAPDEGVLKEVHHLGIDKQISFVKADSNEDLAVLYRGATAFVFPSLYEGFGLPPLEAMACGTVVLASTAAAIPEVVGDAGLLVNPHDVESIAEGIKQLISDSALRAALRQKGLVRARKFTWEKTAERTSEVLQTRLPRGSLCPGAATDKAFGAGI